MDTLTTGQPETLFRPGDIIWECRVDRVIAVDEFGEVYAVRRGSELLVLRVLPNAQPNPADNSGLIALLQRMDREGRSGRQLHHPNFFDVVSDFGFWPPTGPHFLFLLPSAAVLTGGAR